MWPSYMLYALNLFVKAMKIYENQNPVDMHTSIMCINILQNIKAVAPKL
jgi:hypothetical protein